LEVTFLRGSEIYYDGKYNVCLQQKLNYSH
jgi:hypothetical protein